MSSLLHDPSVMIVFSYALTGLGHLRVTDALYRGISEGARPLTIYSQDTSISSIHRFMSIHPVTRMFLEWTQQGTFEWVFAKAYRHILRKRTGILRKQLLTLLNVRFNPPEQVVFVTTHFFMAHQLAAVKKSLEKTTGLKLYLVVQVTDDSPQQFWYVDGADLIVVPSHRTRKRLERFGRKEKLPVVTFTVVPYPISPYLSQTCSADQYNDRMTQLTHASAEAVHVSIPISGAAVGLEFYTHLMARLHAYDRRFVFHIVSKEAPFTAQFLYRTRRKHYAQVMSSAQDKTVVEMYEALYRSTVVGFEVTKPSEQAFKVLASPRRVGGAIMLFTKPVGRQEYDNLNFLERHFLIPGMEEQELLWDMARNNAVFAKTNHYRGVRIPDNPYEAASFIIWCWKQGVFRRMGLYTRPHLEGDHHEDELGPDGVKRFWGKVEEMLHFPARVG